ncbi:uncharacterized protein BO95DRAFT_445972 [Aspergillus brunneoviolaceus CBS 621.78]|uniref:Uncharacterized protein n=1 Tax=Aspergillus brunneoviolaceus CBS 621.78 TaxID=1450534 RepID=A0ACD1FZI2_9EURO|nr:hypothetical protein BO95DRAFT_445972 [Aspergillus brunneoviolaceus CBS 621.78]RAH42416.1 hypothetical protein BO95DRAFT_445972 [Aspergillus brunneoviolaceus CBS 621.78]
MHTDDKDKGRGDGKSASPWTNGFSKSTAWTATLRRKGYCSFNPKYTVEKEQERRTRRNDRQRANRKRQRENVEEEEEEAHGRETRNGHVCSASQGLRERHNRMIHLRLLC